MSDRDEDDGEDATQMMTSRSLVGDASKDALDEEEGDLTVPFDRGAQFAQMVQQQRPRPAAGIPARQRPTAQAPQQAPMPAQRPAAPRTAPVTNAPLRAPSMGSPARVAPHVAPHVSPVVMEADPDLGETGQVTVPVVRSDLPLGSSHEFREFGDTGEQTVPRQLAPKAPSQRPAPQYELPPPAYRPPPPQTPNHPQNPGYGQNPGYAQAPHLAQRATPIPPAPAPHLAQMATPMPQGPSPHLAQMATPMPQGPASSAVPSARGASSPSKVRSPPVFVAVMVACTVLTITGLVLLAYLKMRHFW